MTHLFISVTQIFGSHVDKNISTQKLKLKINAIEMNTETIIEIENISKLKLEFKQKL